MPWWSPARAFLKPRLPRESAFLRSPRVRTAIRIILSRRRAACATVHVPELARVVVAVLPLRLTVSHTV